MPWHALSDGDIEAVSIVTKGANRKRYFLRKEAERPDELVELATDQRVLKSEDWTAVYCVVAEPGWEEGPGVLAKDQSVPDVWASEEEIRKAAHRFMKNGGLINLLHQSLEPYGQLVENAIAPVDFTIEGETIKKGSWYIAFEPNDYARGEIEKGTFGGVSIQGTAQRTLMEKDAALVPNVPGKTNWVERAGGLPKFIADIAGDLISEKGKSTSNAIQLAVGICRNWASGKGKVTAKTRAKAAAAIAEWEAKKGKAAVSKSTLEIDALADDDELLAKAGRFEENKHPRDHGKFSSKPGGRAAGHVDPAHVKQLLHSLGYKGKNAVKDFQRDHGLVVDGTAGSQTYAKLRGKRSGALGGHTPKGWKGTSPAKATAAKWNALPPKVRRQKIKDFHDAGGKLPQGRRFTADGKIATHGGDGKKKRKKVRKGSSADLGSMEGVKDFLEKLGRAVGLSDEDMATLDDVEKAYSTSFADRMAERDFEDELPQAFDVLRSSISNAFYPSPADANPPDPAQLISDNLDEFKDWALELLDTTPIAKLEEQVALDRPFQELLEKRTFTKDQRDKLAEKGHAMGDGSFPIVTVGDLRNAIKALGRADDQAAAKKHIIARAKALNATNLLPDDWKVSKAEGSTEDLRNVESMDSDTALSARVEKLEKDVTKIGEGIEKLVAKAEGEGDSAPTVEDVSKKLDDLTAATVEAVKKIGADIEKLGAGGSAQTDGPAVPTSAEQVEKIYKDRGLDPDLAGIV